MPLVQNVPQQLPTKAAGILALVSKGKPVTPGDNAPVSPRAFQEALKAAGKKNAAQGHPPSAPGRTMKKMGAGKNRSVHTGNGDVSGATTKTTKRPAPAEPGDSETVDEAN